MQRAKLLEHRRGSLLHDGAPPSDAALRPVHCWIHLRVLDVTEDAGSSSLGEDESCMQMKQGHTGARGSRMMSQEIVDYFFVRLGAPWWRQPLYGLKYHRVQSTNFNKASPPTARPLSSDTILFYTLQTPNMEKP